MDNIYGGRIDQNELNSGRSGSGKKSARKKRSSIDVPFLLLTVLILVIGVVMMLSASFASSYYSENSATYYFVRQLIFASVGIVIMLLVSFVPMEFFRRISVLVMGAALFLLVLVTLIGTGGEEAGATRWIDLGIFTFQPSEVAKIAEILLFAGMICTYKDKMSTFRYGVLPFGIVVAVICFLLWLEPHLSAAVIIIAVAAIMMMAGGTKFRWFIIGGIGVLVIGYFVVTKMGYAMDRITAWRHPEEDPLDTGYQIIQSLYAVGSGGLLGLGLGQGRQKYLYLPMEHNDYIFAIVCEELGYIGALLILVLFALLIIRGFWLALHIRDRYSSLVVTGITGLLAVQVFLNVAVVANMLPSTGISLPFFSYGGTALIMQLGEMGIVLSASRDIPLRKAD